MMTGSHQSREVVRERPDPVWGSGKASASKQGEDDLQGKLEDKYSQGN